MIGDRIGYVCNTRTHAIFVSCTNILGTFFKVQTHEIV